MDTSDLRQPIHPSKSDDFDYLAAKPPLELVGIQKQAARRHFGVHGYFTKQVWKVVSTYIETFTQPGDLVLDPFGGTGVTLVESLVLGRKSIHIDINPLSIFIVTNRIAPLNINKLIGHFEQIEERFKSEAPTTDHSCPN